MYPVYLITCFHPSYGQYIMGYVGVVLKEGKTVEQRFAEHLWQRGCTDLYLHRAIKKHGKEWFMVEQIDAGNTPEQCLELEKFWIKRLGTFGHGYNLTEGGDGKAGYTVSEETRRKMSDAHRGEKNHGWGKKQSPESIKARIEKLIGRRETPEQIAAKKQRQVGKPHPRTNVVTDEFRKRMGVIISANWARKREATSVR